MKKAQSDFLCRIIVEVQLAIPNVIVEWYNNKGNVTAIRFYTNKRPRAHVVIRAALQLQQDKVRVCLHLHR